MTKQSLMFWMADLIVLVLDDEYVKNDNVGETDSDSWISFDRYFDLIRRLVTIKVTE